MHTGTHEWLLNEQTNNSTVQWWLCLQLSPKLDNTLPAVLIGNIITSVIANHPTQLQISLAVLLHESTVFTADQQLYRVSLQVQWAHPDLFPNLIPRLGGMHMLMSFVGSIGTLMAETGLAQILESVFGGVEKMLTFQ